MKIDHKHPRWRELVDAFTAQNPHVFESQIHSFEETEDGGFKVVSWGTVEIERSSERVG